MKNRYDAIIFDFDFTLADASEGIRHCLQCAFEDLELEYESPDLEHFTVGITMEKFIEKHSNVSDPGIHESILTKYRAHADIVMTDMTRLFDDTHSSLLHLKQEGYKLGIVSNKYRYRIEEFLDHNNYTYLFDTIIGMEDMENPKPAPDGLLLAMENLETKPDKTLYIGDNPIDAQTAKSAGTAFIGVSRYGHKHFENAEVEFLAILKSLEELKNHL